MFGIDAFLRNNHHLKTRRLGLITNDAVATRELVPVRQALLRAAFRLEVLFAPEHGLQAVGIDGEAQPHTTDYLTGLPVYSLYGPGLGPPEAILSQLDLLLFDLPDIGSRFYTYIWTLSHTLEACARTKTPLWVLDRPNPLSGRLSLAEGPMLDETQLSSFIGRWPIPIRHSLTAGELATYWKAQRPIDVDLTVVSPEGWLRETFFHQWGVPFIPTSPAIPTAETMFTYQALCFLEGTNLSEGRGTVYPFRVCGAPWINGVRLAHAFNALSLAGVRARNVFFTPLEGKFTRQLCQGIMLHVTNFATFRPVLTGLSLIYLLRTQYPEQFAWAPYPTHVNLTGANHFDLLTGQASVRQHLEQSPETFLAALPTMLAVPEWGIMP
ncbi:exo-beta-N-acetylmuramidase NamZ family protein [Arsenicibacter rosenii]|uniref:DUF1343 domain-containing protein n=1 Tax=Arsenicibacter rosenii TaxID=1750698 RepID=A0A1S2VBD8_9BACT|nr:DUF1343 domain-containing protein [Arsenicibacter rosenii]OIN56067.1 hypothetical protein BLX24_26785 [Arsenicibacter rosenii]